MIEPEGERATIFSPTPANAPTFSLLQSKTSKTSLYYWLESVNLLPVYEKLRDNGYDDLDYLVH